MTKAIGKAEELGIVEDERRHDSIEERESLVKGLTDLFRDKLVELVNTTSWGRDVDSLTLTFKEFGGVLDSEEIKVGDLKKKLNK